MLIYYLLPILFLVISFCVVYRSKEIYAVTAQEQSGALSLLLVAIFTDYTPFQLLIIYSVIAFALGTSIAVLISSVKEWLPEKR